MFVCDHIILVALLITFELTAGLAWDWVNQKLYWTDYCDDDLEVYDPVAGVRRVLFSSGFNEPRALIVDPTRGYVCARWMELCNGMPHEQCRKETKFDFRGLVTIVLTV